MSEYLRYNPESSAQSQPELRLPGFVIRPDFTGHAEALTIAVQKLDPTKSYQERLRTLMAEPGISSFLQIRNVEIFIKLYLVDANNITNLEKAVLASTTEVPYPLKDDPMAKYKYNQTLDKLVKKVIDNANLTLPPGFNKNDSSLEFVVKQWLESTRVTSSPDADSAPTTQETVVGAPSEATVHNSGIHPAPVAEVAASSSSGLEDGNANAESVEKSIKIESADVFPEILIKSDLPVGGLINELNSMAIDFTAHPDTRVRHVMLNLKSDLTYQKPFTTFLKLYLYDPNKAKTFCGKLNEYFKKNTLNQEKDGAPALNFDYVNNFKNTLADQANKFVPADEINEVFVLLLHNIENPQSVVEQGPIQSPHVGDETGITDPYEQIVEQRIRVNQLLKTPGRIWQWEMFSGNSYIYYPELVLKLEEKLADLGANQTFFEHPESDPGLAKKVAEVFLALDKESSGKFIYSLAGHKSYDDYRKCVIVNPFEANSEEVGYLQERLDNKTTKEALTATGILECLKQMANSGDRTIPDEFKRRGIKFYDVLNFQDALMGRHHISESKAKSGPFLGIVYKDHLYLAPGNWDDLTLTSISGAKYLFDYWGHWEKIYKTVGNDRQVLNEVALPCVLTRLNQKDEWGVEHRGVLKFGDVRNPGLSPAAQNPKG